jgi:4-hydroxy-2-oxoheptanedioate aldolase
LDIIRDASAKRCPSFGSWITIGDNIATEAMGGAGFDWLILDAQHGGVDWHNMAAALQAVGLGGKQALVRVRALDQGDIMRALDLGADGVIVPMVSTARQAELAAQAVRYPPRGIRSFGKVRSYYAATDDAAPEPLCFVMIETAEALTNLDAIAATPGVDGLFLGPVDLALSLGHALSLDMPPDVLDAIDRVVSLCAKHKIIPGCPSLSPDNARELVSRGMQFITLGADTAFLRQGAAAMVALARELGGE